MLQLDKEQCCGCMACMNICPVGAIKEQEDTRGFIYPEVNLDVCIRCGKCIQVCDWRRDVETDRNIVQAYSLKHKQNETVYASTSGGAFTALSDIMLNKNGTVIGAAMDSGFTLRHCIADTSVERDKMRGSKYTQSSIGLIFQVIKDKLENKEKVMFVGSPCQVAGLRNYLDKEYENLLLIDFLCHGVPNNRLFKNHIVSLENRYHHKAVSYSHRSKFYGWTSPYIEEIVFDSGSIKRSLEVQSYFYFFMNNFSLRPSCFHCRYRSYHRPSDITIADFWGIEKLTGKVDTQGVSLLLVNSIRAQEYLSEANASCEINEVPFEKVTYRISTTPPKPHHKLEDFWSIYLNGGYNKAVSRFVDQSSKARMKLLVKKCYRRLGVKRCIWNSKSVIRKLKR